MCFSQHESGKLPGKFCFHTPWQNLVTQFFSCSLRGKSHSVQSSFGIPQLTLQPLLLITFIRHQVKKSEMPSFVSRKRGKSHLSTPVENTQDTRPSQAGWSSVWPRKGSTALKGWERPALNNWQAQRRDGRSFPSATWRSPLPVFVYQADLRCWNRVAFAFSL